MYVFVGCGNDGEVVDTHTVFDSLDVNYNRAGSEHIGPDSDSPPKSSSSGLISFSIRLCTALV